MTIPLVDLKAQYRSIRPEIDEAVARIFDNTSFCLGPEVETFEQHFAAFCGTKHAVGVSSGTDALALAMMASELGEGDEVITTPFTFIATAAAVSHVGAMPVFVDIDPRTYNIDPSKIEAAITPRTKAILPVHLYGQPADMAAINAVGKAHNLMVIEDSAQAVGATYNAQRAGGLADAGCFSFYCSKNLGAAGDAGMVTTNSDEIASKVRSYRDHGRTTHYGHSRIGFTYRLDSIQAAILDVKLGHLAAWNETRRKHVAAYQELLSPLGMQLPYEAPGCRGVYHLYVVRVPNRDAVMQSLRSKGIGASIHYPIAVHQQPAYSHLGIPEGAFPEAEEAARTVLSIPLYPEMTDGQIETVAAALGEALEGSG